MRRGAIMAAAAIPLLAGCIERRIVVTTDPPGALVWINDQEVGRTPLETGFRFYGQYELRVHKEGHEPIVAVRTASAPWYEYPGPDLVVGALPLRTRSEVRWHFDLVPSEEPGPESTAALVERARGFRDEAPKPAPSAKP
jgi:hypothetical protein